MINYNTLDAFLLYCKEILASSKESDDFFFVTSVLAQMATKDEYLLDVYECFTIYYKWMSECIFKEKYEEAAIIKKALDIELKHYITLSGNIYDKSLTKEIKLINHEIMTKFLKEDE